MSIPCVSAVSEWKPRRRDGGGSSVCLFDDGPGTFSCQAGSGRISLSDGPVIARDDADLFVAGESCVSGAIPAELSQDAVCSVYIENSTQSDLLELSISRTFRTGGEIRLRRRLDPESCPLQRGGTRLQEK